MNIYCYIGAYRRLLKGYFKKDSGKESGKENGNYCLGFRVIWGSGLSPFQAKD